MRISVAVKTNSRVELVELRADGTYLVRVGVLPIDGKANERTRELLAKHFSRPKSAVTIVSGLKSKLKIFEVK